jgi:hypothetical protein
MDSIPALGELYAKQIRFVLGTADFLLFYPPSFFAFGTIRPPLLQFPLSNLLKNYKNLLKN